MKIQWCSIAVALPLALAGCGKDECVPTTDVNSGEVVAAGVEQGPQITEQQKADLHAELMKLVESKAVAGRPVMEATATAWDEILGKDLPLHYVHCSVPKPNCHLYVDETAPGKPGTPARWLSFEKNADGTYWAGIRTSGKEKGYMVCEELTAKSNLSGYCEVRPHNGTGKHWFEFAALQASTGIHESIYYKYFDKKPGAGADVHNGEGHGGSD